MREWDFKMRQVLEVDRQLLGINAEVVDATSLKHLAGKCSPLGLSQRGPLSRKEVLFFKSEAATLATFAMAS